MTLPSLFLAHGAPDLPLSGHVAAQFLAALGARLPRPRAILVISAHWEGSGLALTGAARPETIHDFGGFDPALHQLRYPAATDPWLIEAVRAALAAAAIPVAVDAGAGYDHGTWVPLLLAWPRADIPVVQLSLDRHRDPARHFAIGQALALLRARDVLIIGSGATVHNLRGIAREGTPPPAWATGFDAWLAGCLVAHDAAALCDFARAPGASQAHPTPEHLMPLFVAAGAGWAGGAARRLHDSYSYGSISMATWAFGTEAEITAADPALAA